MILPNFLEHYINRIRTVRRNLKNGIYAPHKPLLLLSIIDLIEAQKIEINQIPIDGVLKAVFDENCQKISKTNKRYLMDYPIHHLQTDGFWKAYDMNGNQLQKERGISKVNFGTLDEPLFQLIQSPTYRPVLRMFILDTFFDDTQQNYWADKMKPAYMVEIEESIVAEPQSKYRQSYRFVEGFVRDHKFRKNLLPLYDYTCCMSGMKTTPDIGLIEACHIEDHALNGNNALTNGIPLCKNLHGAFDAGIISIDDNYRILMKSESKFEEEISLYGIRQLAKQSITLPADERFYPSLEKLAWHRGRFQF